MIRCECDRIWLTEGLNVRCISSFDIFCSRASRYGSVTEYLRPLEEVVTSPFSARQRAWTNDIDIMLAEYCYRVCRSLCWTSSTSHKQVVGSTTMPISFIHAMKPLYEKCCLFSTDTAGSLTYLGFLHPEKLQNKTSTRYSLRLDCLAYHANWGFGAEMRQYTSLFSRHKYDWYLKNWRPDWSVAVDSRDESDSNS